MALVLSDIDEGMQVSHRSTSKNYEITVGLLMDVAGVLLHKVCVPAVIT